MRSGSDGLRWSCFRSPAPTPHLASPPSGGEEYDRPRWHRRHPINNRRILEYLRKTLGCDEAAVLAWCATWINAGFEALETLLAADQQRGAFCFGNTPTLADVYLVPQIESARRFNVDMTPYPTLVSIDQACAGLDAFQRAAPSQQPDAA